MILVEDRQDGSAKADTAQEEPMEPKVLKEWEHVGEVWVKAL